MAVAGWAVVTAVAGLVVAGWAGLVVEVEVVAGLAVAGLEDWAVAGLAVAEWGSLLLEFCIREFQCSFCVRCTYH